MAKKAARKAKGRLPIAYRARDVVPYIQAAVDPFHPAAKNIKIHDNNGAPSITVQARKNYVLSTTANGVATLRFHPLLNECISVYNGTAISVTGQFPGAGVSWSATQVEGYTSIADSCDEFRVVSMGIRLTTVEAALNCKGTVYITEVPGTWQGVGNEYINTSGPRNYNCALTKGMDLTIIPDSNGFQQHEYIPVTSTATSDNYGFQSIRLAVVGATVSTAVINVEVVINIEAIPKINSLGSYLATPAAPDSSHVREAIANTRAQLHHTNPTPTLGSRIKSAIGSLGQMVLNGAADVLLPRATGYLSRLLGGPRSYPRAIEVD